MGWGEAMKGAGRENSASWWYLGLLGQFIIALSVPLYNFVEPALFGIPFFYWFQLALIFICAAATVIVYWITEPLHQD
jgi:hypothetical protein